MAKYRQCFFCGTNLDHGEICDCREKEQQQRAFWEKRTRVSQKNGQVSFRLEGQNVRV